MSQGLISSWMDKGSALEGPMEDRNERQTDKEETAKYLRENNTSTNAEEEDS